MIRKTLAKTQAATFSIDLPNPEFQGMPTPSGTGFFVSPDGWFVTAAHVVADAEGNPRSDAGQAWLQKETRMRPVLSAGAMCQWPELVVYERELDFALFKVDFDRNKGKEWLKGKDGFPHVPVSRRDLDEGEPVYAFGYPLPDARLTVNNEVMTVGTVAHKPRVTSAIVSSTIETTTMIMTEAQLRVYVLDKALNYGNSGGPILATETGQVHGFCSRFQPVLIPQGHWQAPAAPADAFVMIPSLYGVVTSLSNPAIMEALSSRGVTITAN